jgi:hypothetical protein
VVEAGRHRRTLERSFPATPFVWLETSAGSDLVFLLHREDLPVPAPESLQFEQARPGAKSR